MKNASDAAPICTTRDTPFRPVRPPTSVAFLMCSSLRQWTARSRSRRRSLRLLLHREGSNILRAFPFHFQGAAAAFIAIHGHGELIDCRIQFFPLHIDSGQVLFLVVLRPPLTNLLADD